MLTRVHKALLGLLALQIILVIFTRLHGGDVVPQKDTAVLAGFDPKTVTRVQIFANGSDKPVDLVKTGDSWAVASAWNYPAEAAKVTEALEPLAKMMAGAPIATQVGRHAQLKVADADFERKLVITAGGKDTTLYIGAAAGSHRTAIRVGTSANVLGATGINSYAFGADAHSWVDPKYVAISSTELQRIEIAKGDQVVALTPPPPAPEAGSGSAAPVVPPPAGAWSATIGGAPITLAPDETVDSGAIESVATALSAISLAQPADPKRDVSKPLAVITLDHKPAGAAAPTSDIIDVVTDGEGYYIHRRGDAKAVTVDKGQLDAALALDRTKLVKKAAPAAGSAAGSDGLPPGMDGMQLPPGMEGMQLPPGMDMGGPPPDQQ